MQEAPTVTRDSLKPDFLSFALSQSFACEVLCLVGQDGRESRVLDHLLRLLVLSGLRRLCRLHLKRVQDAPCPPSPFNMEILVRISLKKPFFPRSLGFQENLTVSMVISHFFFSFNEGNYFLSKIF